MAEDERAQQSAFFATKLFTLVCAMCIRMLLLTEIEANRQTIRNNSASVIGKIYWQIIAMFLLKPMHSYQPLHGGKLEIFFIHW